MKENKVFLYKFIRFICKPLFWLVYRPVITGRENIPKEGSVVLAGNHKHALDPILIDVSTKRIIRTLAKKELHDGPFGFIFRGVGTIPVDLHSDDNKDALYAAVEVLKRGGAVNVSPEAKRNYTDELLLPFKYGAVSMAKKTGAPIVPYAIAGDYKFFGSRLKIVFGRPFYAGERDLYEVNKELYNKVAKLLISITDKELLKSRKITSFDEWSV